METERLHERQKFEFLFDAAFGDERTRNLRMGELHRSLAKLLTRSGYSIVDNPESVNEDNVMLMSRVKTVESAEEKTARMSLRVMPDVWGLTVIAEENNLDILDALASLCFLDNVPIEDRLFITPSGKTYCVPEHKDYRDPNLDRIAVISDYRAIHIVRKADYGMVELRIIPRETWIRTLDPNDPIHHSNYEERRKQAEGTYRELYG